MKKLVYGLLITALMATSLASGCTISKVMTTRQPTQTSATTPATTGSSAGAPRTGGTLNLYGADPTTLDPAIYGDADSHQYVMEIFSGLVKLDQNMHPVPAIMRWRDRGLIPISFSVGRLVEWE